MRAFGSFYFFFPVLQSRTTTRTMDMFILLCAFIALFLTCKLLKIASKAMPPTLYYQRTAHNASIIQSCPLLTEPYIPPLMWGKSGHVQTIVYGKLGRVKTPFPSGERVSMLMPDGATSTFDIFQPYIDHPSADDVTLAICPGIANSSESLYICTCVHYAQEKGYRVAVLNHLGALPHVPLTSPRIFTYGGTEEYGAMIDEVVCRYPETRIFACGFSMGGNIVLKYAGESREQQENLTGVMSFCQGYDVHRALMYSERWQNMEKLYFLAVSLNHKKLLHWHRDVLFSPEVCEKLGLTAEEVLKCSSILQIDDIYSSKRDGFSSLTEYYDSASSGKVIHNIHIPTLMVNTMDDPLVNSELFNIPMNAAETRENVIFSTLEHGGHLGFFEGGFFQPETITWLDKIVVQYADAVIKTNAVPY